MADELAKRAADMLLRGATLVSEPCPYCRGVRVIKDGDALCIDCGRAPEKRAVAEDGAGPRERRGRPAALQTLERKLEALSCELERETDHPKQLEIIRSIDSLAGAISRIKDGGGGNKVFK